MIEIKEQELAELIDLTVSAINKSVFGPLITYGGTPSEPKKIISQTCYPIFMQVLAGMIAKIDTVKLVPDSPPSDIITDSNNN